VDPPTQDRQYELSELVWSTESVSPLTPDNLNTDSDPSASVTGTRLQHQPLPILPEVSSNEAAYLPTNALDRRGGIPRSDTSQKASSSRASSFSRPADNPQVDPVGVRRTMSENRFNSNVHPTVDAKKTRAVLSARLTENKFPKQQSRRPSDRSVESSRHPVPDKPPVPGDAFFPHSAEEMLRASPLTRDASPLIQLESTHASSKVKQVDDVEVNRISAASAEVLGEKKLVEYLPSYGSGEVSIPSLDSMKEYDDDMNEEYLHIKNNKVLAPGAFVEVTSDLEDDEEFHPRDYSSKPLTDEDVYNKIKV
jgi:hypothetical protein